jgi:hypothetical protein
MRGEHQMPPLNVLIAHERDLIVFDGKVEQDYRFLMYRFPDSNVEARAYLDDVWCVSILRPLFPEPVESAVMTYLQTRFNTVKQLGGPEGYSTLWEKPALQVK